MFLKNININRHVNACDSHGFALESKKKKLNNAVANMS